MNDLDVLRSLRPTDETLANEFSHERREEVLTEILDARLAGTPTASGAERLDSAAPHAAQSKRPHSIPRSALRRRSLVAAGVLVLAGAGVAIQLAPIGEQAPGPVSTMLAPPAAAATLPELALRAENPTPLAEGAFRHVRITSSDQTIDTYVAADGWTWRHDTMPGGGQFYAVIAPQTLDLPRDPVALRAALEQRATGTESPEQALFKEIGEVAMNESASSAVRAAAIRVLDQMANEPAVTRPRPKDPGETTPRVLVEQEDRTGQPVIVARFVDDSRPDVKLTLTFDARTAGLLGQEVGDYRLDFTRDTAGQLPTDIVEAVGTERVEKSKTLNPR
ncbi:hypothetical protein AADG42_15705 [Ammonicoccus fulvus]|uniref:Uncharacterized protein n=1 Tax=Ammonicoccus fulvus TaxID=3138240 RepID=A0ABZ3FVD4_9ACTN